MRTWKTGSVLAAASVIALVQAAVAQQTPQQAQQAADQSAEQKGVRSFEPAFFSRYNPVTAYDMVRQLPGFIIDNGDSLRGFGATAGNVLIDGQRPSTKATSIGDELTRIPARDVARIELIGASAAGDIDVRGYVELANVVLKPAVQVKASTTYVGQLQYQGGHVSTRAGGTRAWKAQDFGGRLQVQASNAQNRGETDIEFYNGAGALTGTRDEFGQQYFNELLINGSFNWTPTARDTLNVTGRIMPRGFNSQSGSISRDTSNTPTAFVADDYTEKDIIYLDLGGDWEHRFSPQNAVKLITVNSLVSWRPQEFFEQFPGTGPRSVATRIDTDNKRGEHVLRGVWTIKPSDKHTVEMGLEGAFNYLDTDRSIFNAVGAGPFTAQFLPVASTRVEELRGEAFIADTWRVNPQLTLDMGFTYEASRITQTGDREREREFTYPKPRIQATWTPTKTDQFTLNLERIVAQLNFSEFASSVQLTQNQTTIGNPDLRPAQTWDTSLQWKRTIGERGSFLIKAFYNRVEDVQDFVIVETSPSRFSTAAGNIGDGDRYGARMEVALPLDGVGVKGGMLKFFAQGRKSMVADPITREDRLFANDFTFDANIDFRQDLPELKLAWGGDYTFPGGETYAYRLTEIQRRDFGHGDLDLFIETTAIKGVTVRLNLDNLGDSPSWLDRRFFDPSRLMSNTVSSREFREQTQGPIVTLSVQGAF